MVGNYERRGESKKSTFTGTEPPSGQDTAQLSSVPIPPPNHPPPPVNICFEGFQGQGNTLSFSSTTVRSFNKKRYEKCGNMRLEPAAIFTPRFLISSPCSGTSHPKLSLQCVVRFLKGFIIWCFYFSFYTLLAFGWVTCA